MSNAFYLHVHETCSKCNGCIYECEHRVKTTLATTTHPNNGDTQVDELKRILDAHAEYYIRQTMKFFQEGGESPALSKNNEGDLKALEDLHQHIDKVVEDILPEKKEVASYKTAAKNQQLSWYYADIAYNQAIDEVRLRYKQLKGES